MIVIRNPAASEKQRAPLILEKVNSSKKKKLNIPPKIFPITSRITSNIKINTVAISQPDKNPITLLRT